MHRRTGHRERRRLGSPIRQRAAVPLPAAFPAAAAEQFHSGRFLGRKRASVQSPAPHNQRQITE